MQSTFLLSNIAPQVGQGFNRDYWARFEAFARSLMYTCDDVYIVTGPLFLPEAAHPGLQLRHPVIGKPPNLISVPTHFYKVILGTCEDSTSGPEVYTVGAFVMPNGVMDPNLPLTAFAVPLEPLESLSGLHFFPDLITREARYDHDVQALRWQARGRKIANQQNALRDSFLTFTGDKSLVSGSADFLQLLTPKPSVTYKIESSSPKIGHNETQPQDLASRELPIGVLETPLEEAARQSAKESFKKSSLQETRSNVYAGDLLHIDSSTSEALVGHKSLVKASPSKSSSPGPGKSPSVQDLLVLEDQELNNLPTIDISLSSQKGHTSNGMLHLCNHTKCRLPPPDWYLKGRQGGAKHLNTSSAPLQDPNATKLAESNTHSIDAIQRTPIE